MQKSKTAKAKVIGDSSKAFQANWRNILTLIPIQVVGLTAWPIYLAFGGEVHLPEVLVFLFMYAFSALGICVGYHRGFCHRSFRMSKLMKFFALFSGSSVPEGSAVTWCADHRRHHRYEDTEKDPYNVRRSFWWAHMGWILGSPSTTDFSNCNDLAKDPMVQNQDRYYTLWFIVSCFLFPLCLGFLVGRPIATFLLAGFFRAAMVQQFTFLINSYAHYFGRKPYSEKITAKDSLVCAVLASGEGWHNYHHRFPFDYRNGHRFYHWDPAKWLIFLGQFVGLTHDLKRTPQAQIYKARLETQRDKVLAPSDRFVALTETVEQALQKWQGISLEWSALKKLKAEDFDQGLQHLKERLHLSKEEFQVVYSEWKCSFREYMRSARNKMANNPAKLA